MRKCALSLTVLLIASLSLSSLVLAQDNTKLAQTGMQFLSVVSDARAAAMAGAMTTMRLKSASLFFNPSCMAENKGFFDLSASYNLWIADIKHSTFSFSLRPASGDIGVFGVSVQYVDYGDILGTRVNPDPNDKLGYIDTGPVKAYGVAVGVGYAKALSDAFSVGGQVRWVRQSLGEGLVPSLGGGTEIRKNAVTAAAFDFGTIFKPGLKSVAFGMSVRNFSKEIKYEEEAFELPLTFTLGISLDVMDFLNDRGLIHTLFVSVDAVHNRDYYEQLYFGADCDLLDVLNLRLGYVTSGDEMGTTFGFGVHQYGLGVDYAYTPFGVFTNAQRFTVRYSL